MRNNGAKKHLHERVRRVRRIARRRLLAYGASLVVLIVLGAAAVLGVVDYLWRFEDSGIRWIFSTLLAASAAAAFFRFFLSSWRHRLSEAEVCRRIETRFPDLDDRLTSTLDGQWLSEENPTRGSPALRREVAAETIQVSDELDFAESLSPITPRRTIALISVIAVVFGGFLIFAPQSVLTAGRRLAAPWSDARWPKRFPLEFVSHPRAIVAGDDFQAVVFSPIGRLPKSVDLEYRLQETADDNLRFEERIRRKPMRPREDGLASARVSNLSQSILYRARGGDELDMAWSFLEVVEPPHTQSFEVVLHPPPYTGRSPTKSDKNIQGLQGSRVEIIHGRSTQALRDASIGIEEQTGGAKQPTDRRTIRLKLDNGGMKFSLSATAENPWVLDASGAYWFDLENRQGFKGGRRQRWEVRVTPDERPNISLSGQQQTQYATPNATLPLEVLAKDDLALKSVVLRWSRPAEGATSDGERTLYPLYQGPPIMPASDSIEIRRLRHRWELRDQAQLQAGQSISYQVIATDYKGQKASSQPRRVEIVTPQEMEERVSGRQALLLSKIREILQAQRGVRTQTQALQIQLQETDSLRQGDLNLLRGAELSQRQVTQLLAQDPDAALSQVRQLVDTIHNNRLNTPALKRRMETLLSRLTTTETEATTKTHESLIEAQSQARALKGQQPTRQRVQRVRDLLQTAMRGQESVIGELERVVEDLSKWDHYRRFAGEIRRLRQEQLLIHENTIRARLAKAAENRDGRQTRADARRLAQRQVELARSFDRTVEQMERMHPRLKQTDPLAAETLQDALEAARRRALSGQMNEAARALDLQQFGVAESLERQLLAGLEELVNILRQRAEIELDRIARNLNQAANQLSQLTSRQRQLRKEAEQLARQEPTDVARDRLASFSQKQSALEDEISRLARRLRQWRADRSSAILQEAAAKAQSAKEAANRGDREQTTQLARQTEKQLEQAERELQKEIQQTREDGAREQWERLAAQLAKLIGGQEQIVREVERLENRPDASKGWSREEQTALAELARRQRSLSHDTSALSPPFSTAPAFLLSVQGAVRRMVQSAANLDRRRAAVAKSHAQAAVVRLRQLRQTVMELATAPRPPTPPTSSDAKDPNSANDSGDRPVEVLSQLKLLKMMQEEIHRHTGQLERSRNSQGELSSEQQQELDELVTEQGRLAEIVLQLSKAINKK